MDEWQAEREILEAHVEALKPILRRLEALAIVGALGSPAPRERLIGQYIQLREDVMKAVRLLSNSPVLGYRSDPRAFVEEAVTMYSLLLADYIVNVAGKDDRAAALVYGRLRQMLERARLEVEREWLQDFRYRLDIVAHELADALEDGDEEMTRACLDDIAGWLDGYVPSERARRGAVRELRRSQAVRSALHWLRSRGQPHRLDDIVRPADDREGGEKG
jgi:hypothetical protein